MKQTRVKGIHEIKLPNRVYYYWFLSEEPKRPPTGRDWLVPREGYKVHTQFFYHRHGGKILFAQTPTTHADMFAKIRWLDHSHWPHYDTWIRGYVVGSSVFGKYAGNRKRLKPRTVKLTGIGLEGRKASALRGFLRRVRSLEAIPGDFQVWIRRMDMGCVSDWW